jgi:hypothetical protein
MILQSVDQGSKMTVFKLILTRFVASVIFKGRLASSKNWLKLKIKSPLANLACLDRCDTLYLT